MADGDGGGQNHMNKKDNDPALMCLVYVLECVWPFKGRYCFNYCV